MYLTILVMLMLPIIYVHVVHMHMCCKFFKLPQAIAAAVFNIAQCNSKILKLHQAIAAVELTLHQITKAWTTLPQDLACMTMILYDTNRYYSSSQLFFRFISSCCTRVNDVFTKTCSKHLLTCCVV